MATLTTDSAAFRQAILDQLLSAEQLDQLHVSLANLSDMVDDSQIDLILDQPLKSPEQKRLYLEKVIDNLYSPELKQALGKLVEKKSFAENMSFFVQKNLGPFVHQLQEEAERIKVIHLSVAVPFAEKEQREICQLLAEKLGQPVVLDLTVNRDLIAGVIIQLGNYIHDFSVRTRLNQFRAQWKMATAEEALKPSKK